MVCYYHMYRGIVKLFCCIQLSKVLLYIKIHCPGSIARSAWPSKFVGDLHHYSVSLQTAFCPRAKGAVSDPVKLQVAARPATTALLWILASISESSSLTVLCPGGCLLQPSANLAGMEGKTPVALTGPLFIVSANDDSSYPLWSSGTSRGWTCCWGKGAADLTCVPFPALLLFSATTIKIGFSLFTPAELPHSIEESLP